MTNHFCTISTKSHLGKTFALCHSVAGLNKKILINVLVTDESKEKVSIPKNLSQNINLFDSEDLKTDGLYNVTFERFSDYSDKMRWTLKSVFLRWLFLRKEAPDKIIYVDNDIFFTGDYNFLFDMLEESNILLTPHWRADNPYFHPWWFETNFRDGVFNAGFIGANKNSVKSLEWWTMACLYKCKKSYLQGLFDDQKYLDLMPVVEPKTKIVHHQGCNVACWNIIKSERNNTENGIMINNENPLIFIHFADCTIASILSGADNNLMQVFSEYKNILTQYGFELNLSFIQKKERFWGHYRHIKWLTTGGMLVILSKNYKQMRLFFDQKP